MYSDDNNIYFKHFMGQYTPMEGKLINAIRALEHRIALLENEKKDVNYVINVKGDRT
jgi:hypothetical protein